MPVTSVRKQLITFGFLIAGVVAFICFLEGFSGSSVLVISNQPSCPSPPLAIGEAAPSGYIPCDYSWQKSLHAVLLAQDWNIYQCLGSQQWAPSNILYLDKSTSSYSPPCGNTVYFLWTGLLGLVVECAYYGYEVAIKYRGDFVLSFVGAGTAENPIAYGNAVFDFHIIRKRTQYSGEVFGKLTTEAQVRIAQKLNEDSQLFAELVEYDANDSSGRELLIYNKHPNEALHYGEPKTVQLGFFPRKVAGTALVTGVYLGRAITPVLDKGELKKYGIEEIPTWQKHRLLTMLEEDTAQEEIPWYFVDDCDARRQEVQESVFKGDKPKDQLITVEALTKGKLQAFLTWIIDLPSQKAAEIQRQRAEAAEEKLAELEKHGIRIDNIKRGPVTEGFKWPEIPRSVLILLILGGVAIAGYLSWYLLLPRVELYLLQGDLSQINALLQNAPASTKDELLKAQQELQQAYQDLQAQGVGALGEARQAISDAGKAIADTIQASAPVSTASSTSINTSPSSTSSRVAGPAG